MNKCCKTLFFTLFVLILLNYYFNSENYVFAQIDKTTTKLQEANNAVGQAFNAILDAEKAGANITLLMNQLNNAVNILAQAENSKRAGNFIGCSSPSRPRIAYCKRSYYLGSRCQTNRYSYRSNHCLVHFSLYNNWWFCIRFGFISSLATV